MKHLKFEELYPLTISGEVFNQIKHLKNGEATTMIEFLSEDESNTLVEGLKKQKTLTFTTKDKQSKTIKMGVIEPISVEHGEHRVKFYLYG